MKSYIEYITEHMGSKDSLETTILTAQQDAWDECRKAIIQILYDEKVGNDTLLRVARVQMPKQVKK